MLAAVKLKHQPTLGTREVGDASSDGMLATELGAGDLAAAQVTPQSSLSVGLAVSKTTGESGCPPRSQGATVLLTLTLSS
jgi:hypothetical protein